METAVLLMDQSVFRQAGSQDLATVIHALIAFILVYCNFMWVFENDLKHQLFCNLKARQLPGQNKGMVLPQCWAACLFPGTT